MKCLLNAAEQISGQEQTPNSPPAAVIGNRVVGEITGKFSLIAELSEEGHRE